MTSLFSNAFMKHFSQRIDTEPCNHPMRLIIESEKPQHPTVSLDQKRSSEAITLGSCHAQCHPARRGLAWHCPRDTTEIYLPFSSRYIINRA